MSRIQINSVLLRLEFSEYLFTYGNHNKAGWNESRFVYIFRNSVPKGAAKLCERERERETLFECTLLRL